MPHAQRYIPKTVAPLKNGAQFSLRLTAAPAAACAGVVFGTTLGSQMAADQQTDLVLEQALAPGLDDTTVTG